LLIHLIRLHETKQNKNKETILTREIQAVEMQYEHEQRYIEDQIAAYEIWMDDKNKTMSDDL
jgi:hypothetical protein